MDLLSRWQLGLIKLKRRRASIEEIASYNLSSAFLAIHWISQAFTARESAAWTQTILAFLHTKDRADWPQTSALLQQDETFRQLLEQLPQELEDLTRSTEPTVFPATRGILAEGELWNALLQMEYQDPRHLELMHVDYIHFLHRVVMMGILPTRYCGAFRTTPVQVGDPRVTFAPPAFIADLMDNFCRSFPRVIPISENYDPILSAAQVSYRFVIIHPYADGNGRVSRLLMNLILWPHFLPVYLRADRQGRRRYAYALKKANRGNIRPLACLIALSLIEIYDNLLHILEEHSTSE